MVSIVMATYNRSHFIAETLDSIRQQSFENWECIIVDDGSTDETKKVLSSYLEEDRRFKYVTRSAEHKKGLPGCRNQGLELANGELVVFFDDDDLVHPDLLELSTREFYSREIQYCRYLRTTFTGTFTPIFDRSKKYRVKNLDSSCLEDIVTNKIPFNSCQVVWDKAVFLKNRFNEDLMYAEEWECYLRILSTPGVKGVSIEKILFYGRKHENSNTGEFKNRNPQRISSKVKAVNLVIENLSAKGVFSKSLFKFFIRTAFLLEEPSIIKTVLKSSNAGLITKWKYRTGLTFYPILRPLFVLKGKVKHLLQA